MSWFQSEWSYWIKRPRINKLRRIVVCIGNPNHFRLVGRYYTGRERNVGRAGYVPRGNAKASGDVYVVAIAVETKLARVE